MKRLLRLVAVLALAAAGLAAPATAGPAYYQAPAPDGDIGINVVGGRPASENYSFLVYSSGCTASLIKANWVVTAGHCPTPSSVRVGSINRSSGGTVARVNGSVTHPTADVKLLRLATSVTQAPAPIPTSSPAVGTGTRIIGWGQTCPVRGACSTPTVAQELDTSVVTDSLCRGGGIRGTVEICTNNPGGNSGACYGDSGGPQVQRVSGRWVLVGATSRSGNGDPRCATGPSIYGDLPAIRSWIVGYTGTLPA
jgi:secreted trypsin-like serine protease